jgi:uncharacterized membrane protein YjgN (DUF898 family)
MKMEHAPRRLSHDGQGGELFRMHMANSVLRVVTLGVFHSWAKTRIRGYLWSHTAFDGERFAYTGQGLALLLGYLAATVMGAVLYGAWQALDFMPASLPLVAALRSLALYGTLMWLTGLALFGSLRFRLAHTRWRGVHFRLAGSAAGFAWRMTLVAALTALTLGLAYPYLRQRLVGWVVNRAGFGSLAFRFDENAGALTRRFLPVVLLAAVLAALLATAALAAGFFRESRWVRLVFWLHARGVDLPPLPAVLAALLLAAAAVALALVPVWLAYRAHELRHFAAHTRLGPLRFALDFTAGQYLRLRVGNFLLLTATLGLGLPLALLRTARFYCRHLSVDGVLDDSLIAQGGPAPSPLGEGLAEVLDVSPF